MIDHESMTSSWLQSSQNETLQRVRFLAEQAPRMSAYSMWFEGMVPREIFGIYTAVKEYVCIFYLSLRILAIFNMSALFSKRVLIDKTYIEMFIFVC